MSSKMQWKTKVSQYESSSSSNEKPEHSPMGLDMGMKGESSITITLPTELNNEGNYDVICEFSGIVFSAWFNISFSLRNNSNASSENKPDIIERLIDKVPLDFTIEL